MVHPSTPASSSTKTGRHDIAEIVLKVAINTKIQIQILPFAASEYSLVSSTFCFLTRTTRHIPELSVARLKYSWLLSSITYKYTKPVGSFNILQLPCYIIMLMMVSTC